MEMFSCWAEQNAFRVAKECGVADDSCPLVLHTYIDRFLPLNLLENNLFLMLSPIRQ